MTRIWLPNPPHGVEIAISKEFNMGARCDRCTRKVWPEDNFQCLYCAVEQHTLPELKRLASAAGDDQKEAARIQAEIDRLAPFRLNNPPEDLR